MASTNEDVSLRLERLEHDVRELSRAVSRAPAAERREDALNDVSLRAWLKLSGPTFAVMLVGFGLLFQAQQANTAQMMELSRSTNEQIAELSRSTSAQLAELNRTVGRLEGVMEELRVQMSELRAEMGELRTQIAQLGASIDKLSERVERLEAH